MMAATEMSISPAMISSASGNATSARSVKLNVASDSVSTFRKYGESDANNTNSHTSTSASMVSQRLQDSRALMCATPRGWCAYACAVAHAEQHGDQDHDAIDEHLPERGDSHQRQTAADDAEEQAPDHHAERGAGTARDRNAADQAGRDHLQLETERDVGVGDRKSRHPQIAADPGDGAADHVGQELHAARIDARVAPPPPDCRPPRTGRAPRASNAARTMNAAAMITREPGQRRESEELAARECQEVARHLVLVDPRAAATADRSTPRYIDMVPSVTTMGGSRSFQTSRPLNAPNIPPASSVSSSTGTTPARARLD